MWLMSKGASVFFLFRFFWKLQDRNCISVMQVRYGWCIPKIKQWIALDDFAPLNSKLTLKFSEIGKTLHLSLYSLELCIITSHYKTYKVWTGCWFAFFFLSKSQERNARLEEQKRNTERAECIFKRLCKTWIFTITFSTVQNPRSNQNKGWMKFDYTNTGARERKTFPRARTHIQQSKNGMLAKRRVRFVLSIQVIPAQLGLHKDLFFTFIQLDRFIMACFTLKH